MKLNGGYFMFDKRVSCTNCKYFELKKDIIAGTTRSWCRYEQVCDINNPYAEKSKIARPKYKHE